MQREETLKDLRLNNLGGLEHDLSWVIEEHKGSLGEPM
jgi:hypothetical protein